MKYRIVVTFFCLYALGDFSAETTRTLKSIDSYEEYGGSPESEEEVVVTTTDSSNKAKESQFNSSNKAEELQGNLTLENGGQKSENDSANLVQTIPIPGVHYGNSKLNMGQSWKSKSGKINLIMQSEGNLVLYNELGVPLWHSGTRKTGQGAEFRADGNFVVYGNGGSIKWSSQTAGYPDARLVIQDDGIMVIYDGNDPIWSSWSEQCIKPKNYKRNSKSGPVEVDLTADNELLAPFGLEKGQWWAFDSGTLVMQEDGSLVLRNKLDKVIWDSNTKGWGSRALFHEDGNIVIYSDTWRPVWSSGTSQHSNAKLVPQKDGNLAMFDGQGSLIWVSNTNRVLNGENANVDIQTTQPIQVRGNSRLNRGESWSSETAELYMQRDGNLVLYDKFGNARWNSRTVKKGWRAVFQIDGNFVVYSKTWKSVWESGTSGHPNSTLAVQNDGNVVIYHGCKIIWSTKIK